MGRAVPSRRDGASRLFERSFYVVAVACACLVSGSMDRARDGHRRSATRPPNILLVIADDLGKDALSIYPGSGERWAKTPVLEKLANEGLLFHNVWSDPVCSATRATILTGKYGFRTGVTSWVRPFASQGGIPVKERSLFRMLDSLSQGRYAQAVIGKWHLADENNGGVNNPGLLGVKHFAGLIAGSQSHYSWSKTVNGTATTCTNYSTAEITSDAMDWIGSQGMRPWFLWLAYMAPHSPLEAPPPALVSPGTQAMMQSGRPIDRYLAAIEALDTELGRLLDAMPAEIRANTIVIWLSDNGTTEEAAQAPFEAGRAKRTLYQGGINVPMVISGRGVRHGETRAFVNTTDLFSTILELTTGSLPPSTDSYSFKEHLARSNARVQRTYLYSELVLDTDTGTWNGWALQMGRYKLHRSVPVGAALFDLAIDPFEKHDLLQGRADAKIGRERLRLEQFGETLRASARMENAGTAP